MKYIALINGGWTAIDDDTYDQIKNVRWYQNKKGYVVDNHGGKLHRIIMNPPKGIQIDHINGSKVDNRKSNLRFATQSENSRNRKKSKNCSSIYKGVIWKERLKKWETRIRYQGKQVYIGIFKNERHAGLAYDLWAKDLYGEFANLNFKS